MAFVKEFKEFAMRGNVVDLAVGVVIGAAAEGEQVAAAAGLVHLGGHVRGFRIVDGGVGGRLGAAAVLAIPQEERPPPQPLQSSACCASSRAV